MSVGKPKMVVQFIGFMKIIDVPIAFLIKEKWICIRTLVARTLFQDTNVP